MDLGIISMRYAKALLRFAEENGQDAEVYAEMQTLSKSCLDVPALAQALLNPVTSEKEKQRLLTIAACGKAEPTKALARFLQLIIAKGRADVMQFVAQSYCSLYREEKHIIEAQLTLPAPADEKVVARLRAVIEAKTKGNIQFRTQIKPDIEGGFILQYGTYRLDASLRTQLDKIRRSLA